MKTHTFAVFAIVAGLSAAGGVAYYLHSPGGGAGMDAGEVVGRVLAASRGGTRASGSGAAACW